jgi:uncharacterized protein YcfL
MMHKVIVVFFTSFFLLACSSQETKSEAMDSEVESGPAELLSFDETVDVEIVWRRSLGKGSGAKNIRLRG